MNWCPRHNESLETAVELRGLVRGPALLVGLADQKPVFDAVAFARTAVETHAIHFAGKAAVQLLTGEHCPLCFVNRAIREAGKNPGVTVDDWVNNAADEALDADIAHQDAPPAVTVLV